MMLASGNEPQLLSATLSQESTADKLTTVLPDALDQIPDALDQTLLKTNTIKAVATAFSAEYNEEEETLTLTAISSNLSTQQ